MKQDAALSGKPRQALSLFDSTCIIVGVIIGAGIYESTPLIAQSTSGPVWLLAAFLLGGLISLIGAACYAELATAYPREGGDYVYLTRAYGRRIGFLFAWAEFWIVRPGNIGAMAYVFARYARELAPGLQGSIVYAAVPVIVLTAVNMLGVNSSKWTQNLLTAAKVVGLSAVVVVGLVAALGSAVPKSPVEPAGGGGFRLAMILVLFTYGGWNEMSFVAAEVKNPRRNILRALLLGTAAVTAIYLLVVWSFVGAIGFQGVRDSEALAADVASPLLGGWGRTAISVLICVSCLGAIHGMIFTGARVYYALGRDHRLFAWLGQWHPRLETPARSIIIQGLVTLAMVVFFGLYQDGFARLIVFTSPLFWFFFLLAGASLIVLRRTDPARPRPWRVVCYPLTPLAFCAASLFMLYSALSYAGSQADDATPWYFQFQSLAPVAVMSLGLLLSVVDQRAGRPDAESTDDQ